MKLKKRKTFPVEKNNEKELKLTIKKLKAKIRELQKRIKILEKTDIVEKPEKEEKEINLSEWKKDFYAEFLKRKKNESNKK